MKEKKKVKKKEFFVYTPNCIYQKEKCLNYLHPHEKNGIYIGRKALGKISLKFSFSHKKKKIFPTITQSISSKKKKLST